MTKIELAGNHNVRRGTWSVPFPGLMYGSTSPTPLRTICPWRRNTSRDHRQYQLPLDQIVAGTRRQRPTNSITLATGPTVVFVGATNRRILEDNYVATAHARNSKVVIFDARIRSLINSVFSIEALGT